MKKLDTNLIFKLARVHENYKDLIKEYCKIVLSYYGSKVKSICLFGSVARGEATLESDIDMLVVIKDLPEDMGKRFDEAAQLFQKLRRTDAYKSMRKLGRSGFISDIFLTPEEVRSHPPILLDLTEEGIILYDKEDFLQKVLEEIKIRLSQLGAKKVKAKKGHYWVLKPDAQLGEEIKI